MKNKLQSHSMASSQGQQSDVPGELFVKSRHDLAASYPLSTLQSSQDLVISRLQVVETGKV